VITSERNGLVVSAISVKDEDSVLLMSTSGQAVRIPMKDVRVMGRSTQGVRLVHLKNGDRVIGAQKIEAIADEN
jgi:DNA gyrase subunit A